MLAKDVADREELYADFLKEVADLCKGIELMEFSTTSTQPSLITTYPSSVDIRMISAGPGLGGGRKVAEDIIEAYRRPSITLA